MVNLLVQLLELGVHFLDGHLGMVELHGGNLVDQLGHGGLDVSPGDLGVDGRVFDGLHATIIEVSDNAEHAHGLVKGRGEVIFGIGVLLQEIFTNDLGDFHNDLLVFGEGLLTDQLHDFLKVVFFLQDGTNSVSHENELGVHGGEEGLQHTIVLTVGDEPVDGGEVLTLGKLLFQTPEDLDDGESGRGDGIGEITTGRRDGTDDSDGTFTSRRTEKASTAGTFVEGGETSGKVGGVTAIGGHFSQTTGDFTESFGPTRGGIGHHGHIHTHITEVFGNGDTGVNRGFTSGDGHVGGIGDQASTVHDADLLAVEFGLEFGEFVEDFGHLVTTFTTTDVDDAVGVGILGKSLGDDGLSATEGAGDTASTTQDRREEGIDDTLTGDQRVIAGELLDDRTRSTDRPQVGHGQLANYAGGLVTDFQESVIQCEFFVVIGLGAVHLDDGALEAGRTHDVVFGNQFILVHTTENITAGNEVALLEVHGLVQPLAFPRRSERDWREVGELERDFGKILENGRKMYD